MSDADWHALTRLQDKSALYADDVYFREGFSDFRHAFGSNASEAAWRVALLLVKPDGIHAGKTEAVLRFAARNDFHPIVVRWTDLNPGRWRELWRYQLTGATLDRLAVNDLVLAGPSLLVLLRDGRQAHVPATVRLQSLKGPSNIDAQRPGCLRRELGQINRVLSFVHCADEPADLVRELAVLLEWPERQSVIAALHRENLSATDRQTLQSTMAAASAACLDPAHSVRSILSALNEVAAGRSPSGAHLDLLIRTASRMEAGEIIGWRDFHRGLLAERIPLPRWDLAAAGSQHILYDEPGRAKLIPPIDHRIWS
jgi:hypothetical protein